MTHFIITNWRFSESSIRKDRISIYWAGILINLVSWKKIPTQYAFHHWNTTKKIWYKETTNRNRIYLIFSSEVSVIWLLSSVSEIILSHTIGHWVKKKIFSQKNMPNIFISHNNAKIWPYLKFYLTRPGLMLFKRLYLRNLTA